MPSAIHYTEVVLHYCLFSHVFFHVSTFVSINPLYSSACSQEQLGENVEDFFFKFTITLTLAIAV